MVGISIHVWNSSVFGQWLVSLLLVRALLFASIPSPCCPKRVDTLLSQDWTQVWHVSALFDHIVLG
jgi:hypothetical protein